MATVESPSSELAGGRQQRARGVRLQAGARSLAGELLGVRRRASATSRSSPASPRCSDSATSTPDRACGGRGRSWSAVRSWWRCASWRWPAQYPIAGSVYQWSKQLSSGFTSWMTGWIYIVGAIVTIAAVAVDWQVVLPQITTKLQFFGTAADAGFTFTKGGAQNALLLGAILIVITTIINMLGVKLMSRINNVGVIAELVGSTSADHPAAVPPAPAAVGDRPLLRLRRRPSLGLLRRAARSAGC